MRAEQADPVGSRQRLPEQELRYWHRGGKLHSTGLATWASSSHSWPGCPPPCAFGQDTRALFLRQACDLGQPTVTAQPAAARPRGLRIPLCRWRASYWDFEQMLTVLCYSCNCWMSGLFEDVQLICGDIWEENPGAIKSATDAIDKSPLPKILGESSLL